MCRSATRFKSVLIMAALFLLFGGWATTSAVTDVDDSFELDGDLLDNTPAGGLNDWENCNCSGAAFPCTATFSTDVLTDGAGQTVYTIGTTKDDLDLDGWHWKNGQVPDKDDILNAYANLYTVGTERLLYVGGDRFDNEGSAFIGAWFYQDPVALSGDGKTAGDFVNPDTGELAKHRDGDLLILAEFSGGGNIASVKVFQWVGTNPSACVSPGILDNDNTLCDITGLGSFGVTQNGTSNPTQLTIPAGCTAEWPVDQKDLAPNLLEDNTFFEVGVNLSTFASDNQCFAAFLLETRSSFSTDAQLKDFVLHAFQPCSCATDKTVAPSELCVGGSATYTYSAINSGGAALDFTLIDDSETPANTADDKYICITTNGGACTVQSAACSFNVPANTTYTCTRTLSTPGDLGPGTHTNVLTGTGTVGSTSLTCDASQATVIVNASPTVIISSETCEPSSASSSFKLCGDVSGGTPPYTCTGGPPWVSSATADCECEITSSSGGSFPLTVTDSKGCFVQASRNVDYCSD